MEKSPGEGIVWQTCYGCAGCWLKKGYITVLLVAEGNYGTRVENHLSCEHPLGAGSL